MRLALSRVGVGSMGRLDHVDVAYTLVSIIEVIEHIKCLTNPPLE